MFLTAALLCGGLALWWAVAWVSPGEGEAVGPSAVETETAVEMRVGLPAAPPREAKEVAPGRSPAGEGIAPVSVARPLPASPQALLVTGTVRNAKGDALPRATILIRSTRDPAFSLSLSPDGAPEMKTRPGKPAYDSVWGTYSDSGGRFSVRGTETVAPLELRVKAPGYQELRVEVVCGTTDLTLILELMITGRALLAAGVSATDFRLHVRRAGSAAGEKSIGVWPLESDGSFGISRLESGLYELAFKHTEREDYLLTVGPLELPGTEAAPERLAAIDLRGLVRHLRFEILGGDAKPVGQGALRWTGRGQKPGSGGVEFIQRGAVEFDCPWPELDLRVRAPRHEELVIQAVRNGCRLDLVPAGGVTLEFDLGCDLRGTELVLYVTRPPGKRIRLTFGRDSAGSVLRPDLPEPGRWGLEWWIIGDRTVTDDGTVRYSFSGRIPTSAEPLSGRDYLDVGEIHLAQRFLIGPDERALEELLAKAR